MIYLLRRNRVNVKKLALSMMALLIITLMPSHIVSAAEASNTQAGASIIEANKTYTESIIF